jgi:ABC-type sugar transport system substrate-binding protein
MGGSSARAFALVGLLCAPAFAAMGVAAQADDFMDQVKADVQKYSGTETDWRGPTSGPKIETGKHIVYMSSNQQNDASQEWGRRFEDVARKAGWTVTTIDGHGSPVGWQQGMNQAIALKPDGIILEADAVSLKSQVLDAHSRTSACSSMYSKIQERSVRPKPTGSSCTRAAKRVLWSPVIANTQSPARSRTPPKRG